MSHPLLHYTFENFALPEPPAAGKGARRKKASRLLPPEARWLLWQWSREIGLQQGIACRAEVLCQLLGTTQQHWRRIREMLESSGLMVLYRAPSKRGRPLAEYRFSERLLHDLESLSTTGNYHHRKIDFVLGRECPPTSSSRSRSSKSGNANLLLAAKRKGHLTSSNRWLIAVLLAHAERSGRVNGLSYTRLGLLTGMSRNQLQSQLAKLHEHGVLAYVQPGRLGSFFGSKMTSTFVFDLDHPVFGSEPSVEVEIMLFSPRRSRSPRTVITGLAEAVFVVACHQVEVEARGGQEVSRESAEQDQEVIEEALALLPEAFEPGPLAKSLASAYDAHSANWLLARLHGYAEQLLSHSWDALSAGQGGPDHPVDKVIDAIARDFPEGLESPNQEGSSEPISEGMASAQSDAGLIQADSVTEADDSHAPHVILLYALAHHLAVQLQPWLIRITREKGGVLLQELSFSLTPDPLRGLSVVRVQGFGKRSSDQRRPISAFVTLDPAVRSDMTTWLT